MPSAPELRRRVWDVLIWSEGGDIRVTATPSSDLRETDCCATGRSRTYASSAGRTRAASSAVGLTSVLFRFPSRERRLTVSQEIQVA